MLQSLRKFKKHRNKTMHGTHSSRCGEFLILPATIVLCLCKVRKSLIKDQKPQLISSGQCTLGTVGFAKWNLGNSQQAALEDFPNTSPGPPPSPRAPVGGSPSRKGRPFSFAPELLLENVASVCRSLRRITEQTMILRPSGF